MKSLLKGLVVGYVATEALDRISVLLYERESEELRKAENLTRARQAYEKAVERIAKAFSIQLTDRQIQEWGWRFHRAFGFLGGVQYLALRKRMPVLSRAGGVVFGLVFFLVVDEFIIYLLKLSPGPTKFSWKVHARGAVSHLAYGIAAENTVRTWDRLAA
jgi:uncharacterized membrane protein YagU involved in acid resistance